VCAAAAFALPSQLELKDCRGALSPLAEAPNPRMTALVANYFHGAEANLGDTDLSLPVRTLTADDEADDDEEDDEEDDDDDGAGGARARRRAKADAATSPSANGGGGRGTPPSAAPAVVAFGSLTAGERLLEPLTRTVMYNVRHLNKRQAAAIMGHIDDAQRHAAAVRCATARRRPPAAARAVAPRAYAGR